MKRLLTKDDFVETYFKIRQRGWNYFLSKFNFNENKRVQSTWDAQGIVASNWWDIPLVRDRWNKILTGDEKKRYEIFFVENFTKPNDQLKVLSLGSGNCSHEISMARYPQFKKITCVDLTEHVFKESKKKAEVLGLENIEFLVADANNFDFQREAYDVIFFNMSLHHFKNISVYLGEKVKKALKPNGKLVLNEFIGPNRLQFPKKQIQAINTCIDLIPKKYRTRLNSKSTKGNISGPGWLRMLVTDPSECVDSASILPTLNKHYKPIYEGNHGGEILMIALKDIAHHFVKLNQEKQEILKQLFDFEDTYLRENPPNFLFGIYKKMDKIE